jgi:hypothetical protein
MEEAVLRVLQLLLKTIWLVYFAPLEAYRKWIIAAAVFFVASIIWARPQEDEMDRDFKKAQGEKCTFWTRTYPMRQFAIYSVGGVDKQYLRMDQFVSGATGRQAEYVVVNSGMAYVWNTWGKTPKQGVKFWNKPAFFMEYFGVDYIKHKDFRCESWAPVKSKFIAPTDITFRLVSASEFEQDTEYTPFLKAHIRESASEER